jgi:hypothetical protein
VSYRIEKDRALQKKLEKQQSHPLDSDASDDSDPDEEGEEPSIMQRRDILSEEECAEFADEIAVIQHKSFSSLKEMKEQERQTKIQAEEKKRKEKEDFEQRLKSILATKLKYDDLLQQDFIFLETHNIQNQLELDQARRDLQMSADDDSEDQEASFLRDCEDSRRRLIEGDGHEYVSDMADDMLRSRSTADKMDNLEAHMRYLYQMSSLDDETKKVMKWSLFSSKGILSEEEKNNIKKVLTWSVSQMTEGLDGIPIRKKDLTLKRTGMYRL